MIATLLLPTSHPVVSGEWRRTGAGLEEGKNVGQKCGTAKGDQTGSRFETNKKSWFFIGFHNDI